MSTARKRLFVYLIMGLSLLITIRFIKDIIKLKASDQRLEAARQEQYQVKGEQAELVRKLQEISQSGWWEKQVRDVFGMAKPDEVVVIVPEEVLKAEKTAEAVKVVKEEESNLAKWWQVFVK